MAGTYIGVWKQAAKRAGLTLDDYLARRDAGEKWCSGCKALHPVTAFGTDSTRQDGRSTVCLEFQRERNKARYTPKPGPHRFGPPPLPARDGDKAQARHRVNRMVQAGRLLPANSLPCTDCGHVWVEGERRHEYDHANGYGVEAHVAVEAVCVTCHHAREVRRGVVRAGRMRRDARRHGLTIEELAARLVTMKYCATCKTWKARPDFNADRSRHDGLDGRCRECGRAHWLTLPARARRMLGADLVPA